MGVFGKAGWLARRRAKKVAALRSRLYALQAQLPYIRAFVKSLNVTMVEKPGYEADDIIGTLARLGEEKGYRIVIITGDKDFRQLISRNVS